MRPLPSGLSFEGEQLPVHRVEFLSDVTYIDASGVRQCEQEIFDHWLRIIRGARQFIVIDMYLYNDFQGPVPELHRPLAREITDALVRQKAKYPAMRAVVISDPVNTFYGGVRSPYFDELRSAGVEVVFTDLTRLRDSNGSWGAIWRPLIRPLGNSRAGWLPTPFGHRVSLRTYLGFLNLKGNHRKVLVADHGDDVIALVTGANVHDGSSAHTNVGLSFTGPAAVDLIRTENAVLAFSGAPPLKLPRPVKRATQPDVTAQVLTESKIRDDILSEIQSSGPGDALDIAMLFVSDRRVITALKSAHRRGAGIRILLDQNRGAFGIKRSGIPNVPVAHELNKAGLEVRWFEPPRQQCHTKILLLRRSDETATMSLGSTNLTRRNLDDFNLETNVVLRGGGTSPVFRDAAIWFDRVWNNRSGKEIHSSEYERHRGSPNLGQHALYRFMERTGWSGF